MKKYIDLRDNSKEGINQAVMTKIEEVVRLGAEGKIDKVLVEAEVKLLTGIREILMVNVSEGDSWLNSATESEVISKVAENKKVNQRVIIKGVSSGLVKEDFVINVVKLQKAIAEKGLSEKFEQMKKLMKEGKTDLGALMEIQGNKDLKTPMQLFRSSDVRAISAAA